MKKARMNISHVRFILCNLKIFSQIVTTFEIWRVPPFFTKTPIFKMKILAFLLKLFKQAKFQANQRF